MTVIAYKDGVLAADTQLFPSGHRTQKLVRLPDGGMAGAAGLWSACYAGLAWLAEGGSLDGRGERAAPDIEDAEFLIVKPDGSRWILENRFPAYPILDEATAIGCGSDYARAWMETGLSAIDAVTKTTGRDPGTGLPVQCLALEPTHEYTGVGTVVEIKPAKRATKKPAPRRKPRKARK